MNSIYEAYKWKLPEFHRVPFFFEKEAFVHTAGKVITAIGALLLPAAAGAIFFSAAPLYGSALAAVIGSTALMYLGFHLIQKEEFLNDPDYRERVQKQMVESLDEFGFDKTFGDFGNTLLDETLITKANIWDIIDKHYDEKQRLGSVLNNQKNSFDLMYEHGIFDQENCKKGFCDAIKAEKDIVVFARQNGWDVFEDTRLISSASHQEVCRKLNNQFINLTFTEIIDSLLSYDLLMILKLNLLDLQFFQNKWKEEPPAQKTLSYAHEHFKEKLETLLLVKILLPEDLRASALKELKEKGFKAMLERYGKMPFEYKVLSREYPEVKDAFLKYLKNTDFIDFARKYYQFAKDNSLLEESIFPGLNYQDLEFIESCCSEASNIYFKHRQEAKLGDDESIDIRFLEQQEVKSIIEKWNTYWGKSKELEDKIVTMGL